MTEFEHTTTRQHETAVSDDSFSVLNDQDVRDAFYGFLKAVDEFKQRRLHEDPNVRAAFDELRQLLNSYAHIDQIAADF
jgi:hypothetical protein